MLGNGSSEFRYDLVVSGQEKLDELLAPAIRSGVLRDIFGPITVPSRDGTSKSR